MGSSASFSGEKETKHRVASLSFVLPLPMFPLSSPSPRSPHTPLATPTHPLRPDVCIAVLPDGLIVVFLSFCSSPHAPSTMHPVFRSTLRGTAGSLASSPKRLIVMSHVMSQEQ